LVGRILIQGAVVGGAFLALAHLSLATDTVRKIARLMCGVALLYALMGALSDITQFAHRLLGIDVPTNQEAPILARSAQEFWGQRWNRYVSAWLSHFVFRPLARLHHPVLGLAAAFVVSAAIHAYLAAAPLGARAGVSMSLFFLVQGLVVLVERRLRLSTWPDSVARGWTIFVVLGPSPLGIDPFLRIFNL
jgi:D-alanyl-lipoteichoic acid acyltransferase DltB (MBOAT superfamily)